MHWADEKGSSNIIAALEHNDRISGVEITNINSSALDKLAAVMQGPFPILTHFLLGSFDGVDPSRF